MQLVKSSVLHWKNIYETYSSWILFLQKSTRSNQFRWSLSNVILLLSCNFKKGKEAPERNSSFVKILNQIIFLLCIAFSEIKVGKRSEILKFAKVFFLNSIITIAIVYLLVQPLTVLTPSFKEMATIPLADYFTFGPLDQANKHCQKDRICFTPKLKTPQLNCHSVSACSTFDRFDAILRKWHLSY